MRNRQNHRNDKRGIEYRHVQIRADGDGDSDAKATDAGYSGHASAFGVVDAYGTAIKQGAFAKTIKDRGDRIPSLYQHNPAWVTGKHKEIREDDFGLFVDVAVIEDSQYGGEVMTLLRGGAPLGMSIGFQTIKSRWYEEEDEDWLDFSHAPKWAQNPDNRDWIEIIEEIRLWESSAVTFPANELAEIDDVRAVELADAITSLTEHIRAGTLSPSHRSLVESLVAAYGQRDTHEPEPPAATTHVEPDPSAGTTPVTQPAAPVRNRNRHAEFALLANELGFTA